VNKEREEKVIIMQGGTQISKKSSNHLKILGASWMTGSNFHRTDPQILGTT
jgi:hypothetical protein